MAGFDGSEVDASNAPPVYSGDPHGSNWPSSIEGGAGGPPNPSVIGIIRKDPRGSFL